MAQATTLIHGRVVDAHGQPVAQARVGWADGPVALPDVMLLSDAQGRFTLAAPAPGHYTLQCHSDAHGQARLAVQAAGQPLTLTLRLPR